MNLFEEYIPNINIIIGNCLEVVKTLPINSIDCVITSPPYWLLRDYNIEEQIGQEKSYQEYINKLTLLFNNIYPILKDTGSCFININDTIYNKTKKYSQKYNCKINKHSLCLIPQRLIIEMVNNNWHFQNMIIWEKSSCVPEAAKNRFTRNFEYILFFTKSNNYYFNNSYNLSNVWKMSTENLRYKHYAPYPIKLVENIIKFAVPPNGTILDPFIGSGTTAIAAKKYNINCIGIELNPEYKQIIMDRING